MKGHRITSTDLAGIEYVGHTGSTSSCIQAITRLIHGGEEIKNALLITCHTHHAFLLVNQYDNVVAVKAGFTSGYLGEGPRGLATALAILYRHNAEIEEYDVEPKLMHRLEFSCLLQDDINSVRNTRPVRPRRWDKYLFDSDTSLRPPNNRLFHYYPSAVPFRLIDERIMDLAVKFHENEDGIIIAAFRRLEETLRSRTGLTEESGTKLFSKAFLSENAPLGWDVPDEGESKGRANLFIAVYMAFRNARVHREQLHEADEGIREFLLVNELFRLEACAVSKDGNNSEKDAQ
jgi:hypothetical protein